MTFTGFYILVGAGIFIAIMFLYTYAGRWIKTLKPKTVKTVNWTGFLVAISGGAAWYVLNKSIYMFITLFGVVIYFLFYSYDKMEKKEEN